MEGHNSGWQDQVWKYEVLIPMHVHHFDGTKRTMLKNSVHDISNVCAYAQSNSMLHCSRHRVVVRSDICSVSISRFQLLRQFEPKANNCPQY